MPLRRLNVRYRLRENGRWSDWSTMNVTRMKLMSIIDFYEKHGIYMEYEAKEVD